MFRETLFERRLIVRFTPSQADASRFKIFAVLWAIAILSHSFSYGSKLRLDEVILFFMAFVVIFRPGFLPIFLVLAGAQVVLAYRDLPNISNHYLFEMLVNLTILTAALCLMVDRRSRHISSDDLYHVFAPVVRIEAVILYFFVVLHKLNTGYLNSETSCAAEMYLRFVHTYPLFPATEWAKIAAMYGSIIVEAAIGLLLFSRRLWLAGIVIGIVFHTLLALEPGNVFFNFTTMLFALFFLFTPDNFIEALYETLASLNRFWTMVASHTLSRLLSRAVVYALIPALLFVLTFRRDLAPSLTSTHARIVWMVYAVCLAVIFAFAVRRMPPSSELRKGWYTLRYAVLALLPAAVIFNGMMPYLGLKTETSFAMFSNLYTEGGVSNHLFIPASWQLWDYQRDLVTVLDTSDRGLLDRAQSGWRWTYFEFRDLMRANPTRNIVYEYQGAVISLAEARENPDFVTPHPSLLRKLLYFRPVVGTVDNHVCTH
jgi:hypothetical protein